jgi:uncharacterized protein (TIGR00251 family)
LIGRSATILVRVIPRAGRTGLAGKRGDAVLVRLAAAPVEGAANEALVAFLADVLACPRRDIAIVGGERSRDKRLRIAGLTIDEIERRLSAATGDRTDER